MDSPVAAAAAQLRALFQEVIATPTTGSERLLATLPASAAALGLVSLAAADDEAQLDAQRRLLEDLAGGHEADPARALLLLAVVLARGGITDETGRRAVAAVYQEGEAAAADADPAAARVACAARLLALLAGWRDAAHRQVAALGDLERAARSGPDLPTALGLLATAADLLRGSPSGPTVSACPGEAAFEALLALALAGGRPRGDDGP